MARALSNQPPILLADEPTGNLDAETSKQVINLLHTMARDLGLCVVVVTHNLSVADEADRVVSLNYGSIETDRRRNGQTAEMANLY